MSEASWPTSDSERVLFLLDASHRVDERLLNEWIETEGASQGYRGDARRVVVPIAKDPENIPTAGLAAAFDLPADTLVVPLRVVWMTSIDAKGTRPRFRDLLKDIRRHPTAVQAQRILTLNPTRAKKIIAAPATIGEMRTRFVARRGEESNAAELADFIVGQAGLALDIAARRFRGGRYKVPRRVAHNLQASAKFRLALESLGREVGKPVSELQAESAEIMKELIAIPRAFWLDVMGLLNRKIISLGYEPEIVFDKAEVERIRQLTRENPAAVLWTHKTHVDGFAVNSILFENDFPAPHILGGVNMAFGGLGFIARRAGAIFIRRSFQDNPLYKMVLRQYIGYLLEKRFVLTWAFEGTRSRVGKLMPPRYGLLKYVIEAAHATDARNLQIIPVAINYDLIGDVASYAREEAGAVKQPESFRWFVGYLRGLRQPMGQIYLDFGEPVVLDEAPSPDDRLAMQKIAFKVGVEVNRVTPITLASLATTILLGAAPRALTAEELVDQMGRFVEWARERDIRITSHFEPGNQAQFLKLSSVLTNHGLISSYDGGPEVVYAIAPEQHGVAGYYRNTISHHFVPKAIAELALLHVLAASEDRVPAFWREVERLRDLFKFEFFYVPTEEFRDEVREELERFVPNFESRLEAEPGFASELLFSLKPFVAHATLLPFVEAYRLVADVAARLDAADSLELKDSVTQSLAYGRQAILQQRITSHASIGKLLFENGHKLLENHDLTKGGDADLGERRSEMSQNFRELARRLDRIRAIALSD